MQMNIEKVKPAIMPLVSSHCAWLQCMIFCWLKFLLALSIGVLKGKVMSLESKRQKLLKRCSKALGTARNRDRPTPGVGFWTFELTELAISSL